MYTQNGITVKSRKVLSNDGDVAVFDDSYTILRDVQTRTQFQKTFPKGQQPPLNGINCDHGNGLEWQPAYVACEHIMPLPTNSAPRYAAHFVPITNDCMGELLCQQCSESEDHTFHSQMHIICAQHLQAMRLLSPDDITKRYEPKPLKVKKAGKVILGNAEQVNAENPTTYPIPSLENRTSLLPKDIAKMVFYDENGHGERMWVTVTKVNEDGTYVGKLHNKPVTVPLKYGQRVEFAPKNLIDLGYTYGKNTLWQGDYDRLVAIGLLKDRKRTDESIRMVAAFKQVVEEHGEQQEQQVA